MKNILLSILPSVIILTMLITSCGSTQTPPPMVTEGPATPTSTITITTTPDLCASENIQAEVDKVHRHMREFDDAVYLVTAILATGIQRDQLSGPIANFQKIRREAEAEVIPPCLTVLKTFQIQHMNSGISYFIAIMSAKDQQAIDQSLAIAVMARQQHDQYVLEFARVLGLTPVPATAFIVPLETPTP